MVLSVSRELKTKREHRGIVAVTLTVQIPACDLEPMPLSEVACKYNGLFVSYQLIGMAAGFDVT